MTDQIQKLAEELENIAFNSGDWNGVAKHVLERELEARLEELNTDILTRISQGEDVLTIYLASRRDKLTYQLQQLRGGE